MAVHLNMDYAVATWFKQIMTLPHRSLSGALEEFLAEEELPHPHGLSEELILLCDL